MTTEAARAIEPDVPPTCRICQGKSGSEVRDGRTVCDVCMGLERSSVPAEPPPPEDHNGPPAPINERRCTGPCGLRLELNTKNFHIDRSAPTGFKSQCKSCHRETDKLARQRRKATRKTGEKRTVSKNATVRESPLLPAIPTELIIPMDPKCRNLNAAQRVLVKVIDLGGGPFLAVEGVDDEPTDTLFNGHQFYLETEQEIDALAATLKQVLRQVDGVP